MRSVFWFRWLVLGLVLLGSNLIGLGRSAAATEPALPSGLVSCLQNGLGAARFEALKAAGAAGQRPELSESERSVAERCAETQSTPADSSSATPAASKSGATAPVSSDNESDGLKPELAACLEKSIPNFNQLRTRAQAGERIEPTAAMRAAAETCFKQYGKPEYQRREPHSSNANSEITNCVTDVLGADRMAALRSGQAKPTTAEKKAIETKCGRHADPSNSSASAAATTPHAEGLTDEQRDCLQKIVGNQRLTEMESGSAVPSETEREKIGQACFGQSAAGRGQSSAAPSSSATSYNPDSLPEPIKICLRQIYGEDALSRMKSGQLTPSESEMAKMKDCSRAYYEKDTQSSPNPSPSPSATQSSESPHSDRVSPTYSAMPEGDRADCVKQALSDHYTDYQAGTYAPSQVEYTKMKACFSN